MTNKPLTEKAIHDDHASFFVDKKAVLLKDVQSAKRLLKSEPLTICEDCKEKWTGLATFCGSCCSKNVKHYIRFEDIDACFQIPDDNQEAAKPGGEDSFVGTQQASSVYDKPPRKSLRKPFSLNGYMIESKV